jgi:hypothetical protein
MKEKRFLGIFSLRIFAKIGFLLTIPLMILSSTALADTIYKGTIYWVNGEPVGNYALGHLTVTTVDHIYFTVNTPGTIEIDLLSAEVTKDWQTFLDKNGDGEIAYIDPHIYLFQNDGFIDTSDFIAQNDDDEEDGDGLADGSVNKMDSFLSRHLEAGNYVLAVGDCHLDLLPAVVGIINFESNGPFTSDPSGIYEVVADHGDYQVTFRGDITIIPIFSSIWLFVSGLICLLGFRMNFKKS